MPHPPRALASTLPLALGFALLAAPLASRPALAQDATAQARRAFRAGLRAARAERWEQARDRFQRAYELSPRPPILVNLGSAQRQLGELLAARSSYRRYLEEGDDPRLRRTVEEQLAELEELIPQLRVRVENLQEGDRVLVDDQALTSPGEPIQLDPGWREVRVLRGERVLQAVRVNVELEGREEVQLSLPEPVAVPGPEEVARGAEPPPSGGDPLEGMDDEDDSKVGLYVGLAAGAVAIVGAVVAVLFLAGGDEDATQGTLPPFSVPVD
ncbi:MAG TPA: heme biosynthesis HemY N-terminal domain-containing protein [Polyangiaceae bacterium LLY-WYZ-15_(1-7)]|nr:heme biosynthesis HemY N-terminal domain-containing protein [Polyangiaceae bacterium LLY-WYZ-15_(1-7)]HJL01828.1 heme biosynthesis HemY N-terminal domain-containing protein [Polyangiaceae bacterium LLY-WYZ-15_(1-7)]HJL09128.1 heme biosynthesis HemY N-terminal domain-containing protein [Polyangiaceae bacterium LLY-WYZ-15_(1-7)]HJL38226.1 heme biosynthesis HemY N-terminal domain-containing protein [Polyangiaceae bacterium LLY-WYZ-15_(1-7)]HJL47697.1 heme biosynthesis HemY N-terminal domain-con